jgi:hypothetical protein
VKVVKTMTYRGLLRRWSNRYHFNGGLPATTGAWNNLFDAITTAEKALYTSEQTIVQALGYAAGSDVPVASKTYSLAGTFSTTDALAPGDAAALLRYATTARTPKNHPVYLFNYFHGAHMSAGDSTHNTLSAGQATAIGGFATSWISGFSDGTTSYVRAGPNGATATGSLVETYITHRDFPR